MEYLLKDYYKSYDIDWKNETNFSLLAKCKANGMIDFDIFIIVFKKLLKIWS